MRRLLTVEICLALVLGGCGGASDSETTSAPLSPAQATTTAPQPSQSSTTGKEDGRGKQTGGSPPRGGEKDRGFSQQSAKAVKVPPISSAPIAGSEAPAPGVKTVKGGDNSVQTYGVEASESERTEAAIALQAYLNARLEEDWASACSYLAQRPKEELEKLAQQLRSQGKDTAGCAETMAALGAGASPSQLREDATITEVLSFRGEGEVSGDPSYLIFKGPPGSTLYSMPMYLEAGGWKVGLAMPSELPV